LSLFYLTFYVIYGASSQAWLIEAVVCLLVHRLFRCPLAPDNGWIPLARANQLPLPRL